MIPLRAWRQRVPMYGPLLVTTLLLPFLGLFALGVAYPLAGAVIESVRAGDRFAGQYLTLVEDRAFWIVLRRTLQSAALVSAISLALAYPTADWINRSSPKARPLLLTLVVVPLWSSPIARIYGWFGFFVRDGVLDRIASLFGGGPLALLYTQAAAVVGMVHLSVPLVLLSCYAALRTYDERLTMASRSLGASRLRTLVLVKLPVLAAPILAGTVGAFVLALGFFETPALLGGPRSQLISNLIYQQVFDRFDFSRAQAMSVLLLLTTLGTLGLLGGALQVVRRQRR